MDRFYTPPSLAEALIDRSGIQLTQTDLVADFAAGSGELLRAAGMRLQGVHFVANDLDQHAARLLRKEFPHWRVGSADFLNPRSRAASKILQSVKGRIALALLNPPFSFRGGQYVCGKAGDDQVRCSPAAAFILGSLEYLNDSGVVMAILPAGSIASEKDSSAWHWIRKEYEVDILASNCRNTFQKCSPRTLIVRIARAGDQAWDYKRHAQVNPILNSGGEIVLIATIRGTAAFHTTTNGGFGATVVHTVHLHNHKVLFGDQRAERGRTVNGPAVLLPRVGRPMIEKVCLFESTDEVILSDCVIALRFRSLRDARRALHRIVTNWNILAEAYTGTCAPYLTMLALARVLRHMGIVAGHV